MGLGVALGKRSSSGDGCGVEEALGDGSGMVVGCRTRKENARTRRVDEAA